MLHLPAKLLTFRRRLQTPKKQKLHPGSLNLPRRGPHLRYLGWLWPWKKPRASNSFSLVDSPENLQEIYRQTCNLQLDRRHKRSPQIQQRLLHKYGHRRCKLQSSHLQKRIKVEAKHRLSKHHQYFCNRGHLLRRPMPPEIHKCQNTPVKTRRTQQSLPHIQW